MNFLSGYSGQLLSVLRIVSALIFIAHGTAKLFGFPATEMFATPPEPMTIMWFGGILEAFGGALLLIGLFTRPVAFVLSGMMAVAYWMFHAPQSPHPVQNGGDAAILYCFIFLYIAAAGGGAWAADNLLGKKKS
jgi:putative oxidoreductase